MGLLGGYGSKTNKKLVEKALKKYAKPERKLVICPRCRTRATVTFLGQGDSYTCKQCGYKIYANEM